MLGSCTSFLLDQSPDEECWLASSLQRCASLPLCADLFEHLWSFVSAIMSRPLCSPPTHNSWHSPEPGRHGGGVLHSVHRPYARLITWNWHRVKCLHAAEWQQPPVTWIKSSTYDGALSVELKACRPPPKALTQHTPHPLAHSAIFLLQAYCM